MKATAETFHVASFDGRVGGAVDENKLQSKRRSRVKRQAGANAAFLFVVVALSHHTV